MDDAVMNIDIEQIRASCKSMRENGKSIEFIKNNVEEALHRKALALSETSEPNLLEENVRQLLALVFQIAKEELCAKASTVSVIQDVFDTISIEWCERLFVVVEDNLSLWKTPFFYEPCKNLVLRMCNDLLKRLSRTVDTSFCGRILVLLARALPLCEKSGLNLVSHFNVDNVTKFDLVESTVDSEVNEDGEEMETGEIKEGRDIPVDFALYAKFWQLQTFFSSPNNCYDRSKWNTFQQNTNDVLNVLTSHKLGGSTQADDQSRRKRQHDGAPSSAPADVTSSSASALLNSTRDGDTVEKNAFFAKYVTSQKLLQLQLNDSQFRRYFLVQCLVLYQYLVSDVKFKDKSYTLNDEQLRFIIESTEKCYRLLRDTHPKGSHFADSVKKILQREKEWSEWKNKGCADYTLLIDKEKMCPIARRPRNTYKPTEIDLGSPVLTNLWKIDPDMLDACQDSKRKFAPSMVDFLQNPLLELDPEQMVEDQYMSVNNESFQWRASRMLMHESPAYFQMPCKRNEVTATMGPFLEEVIKQTALAIPELKDDVSRCMKSKAEPDASLVKNDSPASIAQNGNSECTESLPLVSDAHVKELAELLADSWKKLADALIADENFSPSSTQEPSKVVVSILNRWRQKEGDAATVKKLSSLLLEAELFNEQIRPVFKASSTSRNPTK